MLALSGINTNVTGLMNQNVGAAHVELVMGTRAESVEGPKTESAVGLLVLSKGGESEHVKGTKTTMVGGAIIDLVKGGHVVQAGAQATFVGAFHKMQAKSAIVFKCGGSQVVINNAGVTIKSAMISITAGKIQIPKAVTEV
jgi:type VI secretion system secreted protein VgrG